MSILYTLITNIILILLLILIDINVFSLELFNKTHIGISTKTILLTIKQLAFACILISHVIAGAIILFH